MKSFGIGLKHRGLFLFSLIERQFIPPVSEENNPFKQEAGMHMWRTIPFEKMGWRNVRQSHRDAIINHLKVNKLKYIFYKVKRL
ncbi:hypothetical protein Hanom_Chr12g01090411 [Helianthus anomalus]